MRLIRGTLALMLVAMATVAAARELEVIERHYRHGDEIVPIVRRGGSGDTGGLLVRSRRATESRYSAWVKVEEVP